MPMSLVALPTPNLDASDGALVVDGATGAGVGGSALSAPSVVDVALPCAVAGATRT
jgi:hypothetical protein